MRLEGPGAPAESEGAEEDPGFDLERRAREDEEGAPFERLPALPVEDGLKKQGKRDPASPLRGFASLEPLRFGIARDAGLFRARIDRERGSLSSCPGWPVLVGQDNAVEADDSAGFLFEKAPERRAERQRQEENGVSAPFGDGREDAPFCAREEGVGGRVPGGRRDARGGLSSPGLRAGTRDGVQIAEVREVGHAQLFEHGVPSRGVPRLLEARGEVACEGREGGLALLERGLGPAGRELSGDEEKPRGAEEENEKDRRDEQEIRHEEPAPHAPQKAAQEVPRRADGEDGNAEDAGDDAQGANRRHGAEQCSSQEDEARDFERPGRLHGVGAVLAGRAASGCSDSPAAYVVCDGNARYVPAFSTTSSSMRRSSSC